jgi:catechol 2,3-dioxygenase-like lactoylglutathione lyase family enzyme
MLGNTNICAVLAVKDLDEAKTFYEQTLGLTKVSENPGGVLYKSGESQVFVYPSEFAGTNKATAASWAVDDLTSVAAGLKEKGVNFEHYDNMPDTTMEGDIHVMGDIKSVWFKDPSGNILSVSNVF